MATALLVAACSSESGPGAVEDQADANGGEHEEAPITVAPDREAEGEATTGATLDDSELEAPSAAEEVGDPGGAEAPTSTIDVLDDAGRAEEPSTSTTPPAERPEVDEGQPIPAAEQPEEPVEPEQPDQSGEVVEPQEPSESEEPKQIEGPEQPEPEPVEPTPIAEVIASGSPAPEWPFRGLVQAEYVLDSDADYSAYVIRYFDSSDRSITETVVEGVNPPNCYWASIGAVSEAGVTVSGGRRTIVVPWGETARVVPPDQYSDSDASWQDIRSASQDLTHGYVIGGMPFDVSLHNNGVRVSAGAVAANYRYPYHGDDEPPENPELYGGVLGSWEGVRFLGTDGEFVGFVTWPSEPACAPGKAYLLSMRTGEVAACAHLGGGLVLVQPPDEGLLVEEIALPDNRQLHAEQCGNLTERWGSLPPSGAPYPPRHPGPEAAPLPMTTAPEWPFRGVVLALQRLVPDISSYETVLQYRSSEDGSMTEFVFGPMSTRSYVLLLEADETAVELSRGDWAVRVPWGGPAELVDAERRRAGPARTTTFPTLIEFGWNRVRIEIESFAAEQLITRLGVGPYWAGGEESWYVWSAPDERLINTQVSVRTRRPASSSFWLRGTDGRVVAVSQQTFGSEFCAYRCDPVLTLLISLETGEVLNCGVELDGADALVFVAPAGSSMTSDVKLPPSGWLDRDQCYSYPTDDVSGCSWLWLFTVDDPECGRFFELARSDAIARVSLIPARIRIDIDRRDLLIQPAASE